MHVFSVDQTSKMATIAGQNFNLGSYGKIIFFKTLHEVPYKILNFLCQSKIHDGCQRRTNNIEYGENIKKLFRSETFEMVEGKVCLLHFRFLFDFVLIINPRWPP